MKIDCHIPVEERALTNSFLETYEGYVAQSTLISNEVEAKKSKEVKLFCRFCKRTSTEVTFKEKTHVIPKSLGNEGLFSDDECDTCNRFFGEFERNLVTYLGTFRVFNNVKNGNRIPKFTSANHNIEIRKIGEAVTLIKRVSHDEDINVNIETGTFDINIEAGRYIPAYVYNAFLKMALSILPTQDIGDYQQAFKYILDKKRYEYYLVPRSVKVVESDVEYQWPFAVLYKKKPCVTERVPLHIFCVYVKNLMFQIIFPLSRQDIESGNGEIYWKDAPYLLFGSNHDNIIRSRHEDELNSLEKQKRDNSIHFKFDLSVLDNLAAIDAKGFLDNLE